MSVRGDFPWLSRTALTALLSSWRRRLVGEVVTRVTAGPGWVGLTLGADPRAYVFLLSRPGAVLLWEAPELPPGPVRTALGWIRKPPLAVHLTHGRLTEVGLLPDDRVIALTLRTERTTAQCHLLHQLFGPRGNLVLLDDGGRLLWSLYRPPHASLTQVPPTVTFTDTNQAGQLGEAPDELFRVAALDQVHRHLTLELETRLARRLRQAQGTTQRLVENLRRDLDTAQRGDERRLAAEILAIHLPEIPRGAREITLPDPSGGPELHIVLDPALSPAANMEHYFRLARKAERGRDIIKQRLAAAQDRLEQLRQKRTDLAAISTQPEVRLAALLAWQHENASLLGANGLPGAAAKRRAADAAELGRPFRRFRLEDKWEIWIGRSNAENDTLTHHAAAPNDLWFHAQGVPGSHVILRTVGKPELIPKRILSKAAALAALYSKARHSQLAPVVYTRRKYVRKPRRSPPGTATCIREKSLFVKPGIPQGAERI
jgi:predicted ribosome quality control (RQC) complex YloA/Tae2 family protein